MEIEDDEFPRLREQYWFVDSVGNVFGDCWYDSTADNYRKDFLRIFKTKKRMQTIFRNSKSI